MIHLTEHLWIGNSDDGKKFSESEVGGVLNVAQDLRGKCGWPNVEYMQVGLVDGPGNETVDYCAAVLALVALSCRHEVVVVYDHDGGRALAVAMMHMNLTLGKYRPNPTSWSRWLTWGERLTEAEKSAKVVLPVSHSAHIEAFGKIPYGVLEAIL